MNRHHPYGGGSFEMRRGGPPTGPGPDRPQRFSGHNNRGRGFGRGRGGGYGGNSFDGNMSNGAYDQGPPADPSMAPYNNYEAPPQDPYFQNNYGAGPQYPPGPPPSAGYDQGYGNGNYNEGGELELRAQISMTDSVVAAPAVPRFAKTEMIRFTTLSLKNGFNASAHAVLYSSATLRRVIYETDSQDVRNIFEEHGEIKTFFDLISTRGMVFVTYFDLRAAERARDRLQGSEISGRPIDVHYSLPRDDHAKGGDRDKNQQLQGCLQVTLRSSPSGQPIDDNEVRHKFQQFGDVKSVKPVGDRPDSRYVEFYDTRACDEAYDRLRHQGLQDGVMDIVFAWDVNEGNGPTGQKVGGLPYFLSSQLTLMLLAMVTTGSEVDAGDEGTTEGNRGRGGGRGGRGWNDDHHGGRDRRGGRFDEDYNNNNYRGGGPGGGGRPPYNNNNNGYDGRGPGPAPYGGGYGGPSGPPNNYGPAPAPTSTSRAKPAADRRASRASPQGSSKGGAPPAAPPPGAPGPSQMMQPPYGAYGPPPPGAMPQPQYGMPPPGTMPQPQYGGPPPPPQPQPGQPPQNPAAMQGLPPHILALLQQAQQQQQQQPGPPPPSPYNMPGMPPGGMPPPPGMMNTPPPNGNPQQYQQLLYHLRAQAGATQK
ncbi:Mei2 protein [Mycena venus]|uniref:Mei2 protein n=1 Tax=Mycena venus TaxID=2733690 RepID=A0A8H6XSV4_9AGAR|nr:Mei2 protein [Mycena venus]